MSLARRAVAVRSRVTLRGATSVALAVGGLAVLALLAQFELQFSATLRNMDALNRDMAGLASSVSSTNASLAALGELRQVQASIGTLGPALAQVNTQLDAVRSNTGGVAGIPALSSQLVALQQQIAGLQAAIAPLATDVAPVPGMAGDVGGMATSLAQVSQQLAAMQSVLRDMASHLAHIDSKTSLFP